MNNLVIPPSTCLNKTKREWCVCVCARAHTCVEGGGGGCSLRTSYNLDTFFLLLLWSYSKLVSGLPGSIQLQAVAGRSQEVTDALN
jgi:hypothetical protein